MKKIILLYLFLMANMIFPQTIRMIELPGAAFNDVSVDGKYVCGILNYSRAFVWSENTGLINLSPEDNGTGFGVSNTGRVVGQRPDSNFTTPSGDIVVVGGYWEPDGSWHAIGNFPGIVPFDPTFFGNATCISADGTIIGGYGAHSNYHPEAFMWSEANQFFRMMGDNEYQGTRAVSLSADGQVLGGWISGPGIFWHPSIWNPNLFELGTWNPDYNMGDVAALNSDGTIAFGKAGGLYWPVPMYWSAATGLVNLTDTNLNYEGYALGGSDDASIIGGDIGPFGSKYGFIWTPAEGMRPFKDWLSDQGITLGNNWIIQSVADISADGKVIIAWGDNTDTPQTITDGLVIIIEDVVPVELTSFSATSNNNVVNLNWSTATELNNSGFEIQRKGENSAWNAIGFIKGNGTTTSNNSYSYADQNPIAGTNTYRLKQVDYDGTFKYSQEVEVEIVPAEYILQQNYPNPFNPTTTINFSLPKEDFVNVTVFNSLGEKIVTLANDMMNAGSHNLKFDANGFASGMYILKMTSGSFSKTIKMNLLK